MEFNVDAVETVDQETVEKDEAQFPLIQWHYGDPKLKKYGGMDYQGGFFASEAYAPDLTPYGWEKTTWTHQDGSETEGYYIRDIQVALVRSRRRWEVSNGKERGNYAWNDWDKAKAAQGSASGRQHHLMVIKGLEELGPFVLTVKGVAGMYLDGTSRIKGAISEFDKIVVRAANDMVKAKGSNKSFPRRAFWLTVGAARDGEGFPVFTEFGQGNDKSHLVMPVALGLPEKSSEVDLNEYYVGDELLKPFEEIYKEHDEWATAWNEIEPGSSEERAEENEAQAEVEELDEVKLAELGM